MNIFDRVLLYARTVRHLRWEQWVYRPIRRLQQYLPVRVKPRTQPPLDERFQTLADEIHAWGAGDLEYGIRRANAVLAGEFRFLNHSEQLIEIDWSQRYVSHLWSYNLHYFDYALDLAWAFLETGDKRYCGHFIDMVNSWIAGNPPGQGDGWEPYAVSLRVVNWLYALLLFGETINRATRERIEASLAMQFEYLSRRLELHILANHLQKNLKALVIGGLYFSGRSADRWLRRGSRLLWRELFEQVLPDGGHYERSPMYHAIALGDFLEVVALLHAVGEPLPEPALDRVRQMVRAMAILSGSDGRLHLFNDAAQGIAPPRAWLSALAEHAVGERIPQRDGELRLPDTGYFGYSRLAAGERLVIDCGPLGPNYQLGHGHCDLLSFEWIVHDRPVVVDSGVSGYEGDPLREYVRSTRAHNTVSIDGYEQAEVWGTFRVARRPRAIGATAELSGERYRFEGVYHPYFDRRITHRRTLVRNEGGLEIHDRIKGVSRGSATSYLHLHPDFELRQRGDVHLASDGELELEIETWGAERVRVYRGGADPAQGWYCPEFGIAVPAPVLVLEAPVNGAHEFGFHIRVNHCATETTVFTDATAQIK